MRACVRACVRSCVWFIPGLNDDLDSLGVGHELSARVNGRHHHTHVERPLLRVYKGDDHVGGVGLVPQHYVPCSLHRASRHLVVEVKAREEQAGPR